MPKLSMISKSKLKSISIILAINYKRRFIKNKLKGKKKTKK